jgi:hypothetical protein
MKMDRVGWVLKNTPNGPEYFFDHDAYLLNCNKTKKGYKAYIVLNHKFLSKVIFDLLKNEGAMTAPDIKQYLELAPHIEEKCIWGALYGNKQAFARDESNKKWHAMSDNFTTFEKKVKKTMRTRGYDINKFS